MISLSFYKYEFLLWKKNLSFNWLRHVTRKCKYTSTRREWNKHYYSDKNWLSHSHYRRLHWARHTLTHTFEMCWTKRFWCQLIHWCKCWDIQTSNLNNSTAHSLNSDNLSVSAAIRLLLHTRHKTQHTILFSFANCVCFFALKVHKWMTHVKTDFRRAVSDCVNASEWTKSRKKREERFKVIAVRYFHSVGFVTLLLQFNNC